MYSWIGNLIVRFITRRKYKFGDFPSWALVTCAVLSYAGLLLGRPLVELTQVFASTATHIWPWHWGPYGFACFFLLIMLWTPMGVFLIISQESKRILAERWLR